MYRAIDREGNLVDSMLSATRDMAAAQRFFRGTLSVVGEAPQQVTRTGTIRIRVRFAKCSATTSNIAAALISTDASSRIIAESNSGTTQCWALVLSTRRSASVERSRKCGSTFVHGAKESNSFHSHASRRQFVTRAQALQSMFLAA